MPEIKNFVHYMDIVLETFVFTSIPVNAELAKSIWNLKFNDSGEQDGELRYKLKTTDAKVKKTILDLIQIIPMDSIISEFTKGFNFEVNKMIKGEYIPMHNELSQKSPLEILIWLTKTDDFEGREFVMEIDGETSKIKPYNGLVCFVDTTCPNAYHGVTELLTDTEIITIVGGLGRKNGYITKNK